MGIIRRKDFNISGDQATQDVDLIDTPDKLLKFAEFNRIPTLPLGVAEVAKKIGIHIEVLPLKNDLSGILYKDEKNNKWVIQVNSNHHPNRQRYTIAHELGHFCLHKHLEHIFEDHIFFRGGESSPVEWQANDFASTILIPENKFRELVRSGNREIEELAEIFQVSTLALRIRAKNLGMSGHGL
jgi:Zn-dependent peptidase ImmA (M78 family)